MILSHTDLQRAIEEDELQFSPNLEPDQIGEASIDLRIGFSFFQLKKDAITSSMVVSLAEGLRLPESVWAEKTLRSRDEHGKSESYELAPGDFILAMTHESVTIPRHLLGRIEGRSSYARVGMSMHQTAPWIQPGWSGRIVLEIKNNGPLSIALRPTKDRPCQLTLHMLSSPVPEDEAYGSRVRDRFQNQVGPFPKA